MCLDGRVDASLCIEAERFEILAVLPAGDQAEESCLALALFDTLAGSRRAQVHPIALLGTGRVVGVRLLSESNQHAWPSSLATGWLCAQMRFPVELSDGNNRDPHGVALLDQIRHVSRQRLIYVLSCQDDAATLGYGLGGLYYQQGPSRVLTLLSRTVTRYEVRL